MLAAHVGYITPSTLWCLSHELFKLTKSQQRMRLKVTFTVHDHFGGDFSNLINLAQTLKKPAELIDVFLKAVIRSQKPLAYDQLITRYHDSLHHISSLAELSLVEDQHLPQWSRILFR